MWKWWVALGAVIILAVSGVAVIREVRNVASTHAACASIHAYRAKVGPVQRIGHGEEITVLGDSYSTGDELKNRDDAWTHQFSAAQHSELDVVAEGGTGFTAHGFCGDGSYGERVGTAADLGNDLVIVEGGLNDTDSPGTVTAAARSVLNRLHGHVIVVGPVNAPSVSGERAVDAALRVAAIREGDTYVSALHWGDLEFGADGKHLTPAGHRTYARHVAVAVAG